MRLILSTLTLLTLLWPALSNAQPLTCKDPVTLWRAEYGLQGFAKPYCQANCTQNDPGDQEVSACATTLIQAAAADFKRGADFDHAREIDLQIQLLLAWHGRPLDDRSWTAYFKKNYP